jgi:hypothetical protein
MFTAPVRSPAKLWRIFVKERTIRLVDARKTTAVKSGSGTMEQHMSNADKSAAGKPQPAGRVPAYSTFPHVTTHGPRDTRCFHGKPEDWKRSNVRRTFGGKVK